MLVNRDNYESWSYPITFSVLYLLWSRLCSHILPIPSTIPVVKQFFESQVYDEYVIKGNAAIFKCQTPSFVADHIDITDWIDTEGGVYTKNITGTVLWRRLS